MRWSCSRSRCPALTRALPPWLSLLAPRSCVYGDGFGCAVACSISAAVQALLLRFWLPADGAVPAAKYAFGSGATAAATGLKAGEYQVVESQGLGAAPGSYNSTSL